jgi:hypothetical protein
MLADTALTHWLNYMNLTFVADSAQEAKQKALSTLLCGVDQQHKDNLKEVDDCLLLKSLVIYLFILRQTRQAAGSGQSGKAISQLVFNATRIAVRHSSSL